MSYRDSGLVVEAERFRTGATTHWLTGTLYRYFNMTDANEQDKMEELLRKFVASKGVGRKLTDAEIEAIYKKLGWPRETKSV